MENAPETVRHYLKKEISKLLQNPYAEEWVAANLDFYDQSRTEYILQGLRKFVK